MKLSELLSELKRTPLTAGFGKQIEILQCRYGNEYIQTAEAILDIFESLDLDVIKISRKYIYDYLKQLEYFIEYEEYGHENFEHVKSEIYDNEKTMMETYLPGLLLSYAYTTILGAKTHLFLTEFLTRINESMSGIEVGFGEGFYLWEVFRKYPQIEMAGYDISPYAIRFADNLLKQSGVETEKYCLQYGNIFEGILQPDETADFGICAELIEHIPNPEIGIREVARIIKKNGLLYMTTVINSNHMDHISNFESPDIVRKMLIQEGLDILAENVYYMSDDFPESKDISVGLAFVLKKI